MQGALALACSNMSRTRLAPTPTNISTKSEPEIEKKGTLASPAMALPIAFYRCPEGLTKRLWEYDRKALKLRQVFQKLDDFLQIILGFINTGYIVKCDAALRFIEQFGF